MAFQGFHRALNRKFFLNFKEKGWKREAWSFLLSCPYNTMGMIPSAQTQPGRNTQYKSTENGKQKQSFLKLPIWKAEIKLKVDAHIDLNILRKKKIFLWTLIIPYVGSKEKKLPVHFNFSSSQERMSSAEQ